jgi:hypothetical protein
MDKFSKNSQLSNFMNIRLVLVELFLEDEQTGGQMDGQPQTKLIITFRSVSDASKTEYFVYDAT